LLILCTISSFAIAGEKPIIIPEVRLQPKKQLKITQEERIQSTSITKKQIAKSNATDITELLQQEQSIVRISDTSGDNSQTALSLRGFGETASANSLILVDGFPLTNPSLLIPNINAIALADIERIDIFQGSAGSRFGDQAVGGVVSIITKSPKLNKPYTTFLLAAGSQNKKVFDVAAGNKFTNNMFIKAYASLNVTDGFRRHNQQAANNIFLQIGKDDARGTTAINVQRYYNTINYPGGLTEAQYRDDPYSASNYQNSSHYLTNTIQFLNKREINPDWLLETRLQHHDTQNEGYVYASFNRNDATNYLNQMIVGKLAGTPMQFGYVLQNNQYSLQRKQTRSGAHATQQQLYGEIIYPISQTIDITLGARAGKQNSQIHPLDSAAIAAHDQVFVTEQGITFHPNSAWSFFLRRDGNFSFPKANEETLAASGTTLNVQTGTSYETGATWQTKRMRSQINAYRLLLHNEIAFNPIETPLQPFGMFTNFNRTVRNGVTLTEQISVLPELMVNGQFNYVDARFASGDDRGKHIPAVPSITANANLNYTFMPNWQAKYAILYTGSQFASDDLENAGKKVAGYYLQDIAISYQWRNMMISFDVGNVFNQVYSAFTMYQSTTKTNTYYPGKGRSFLVTWKVNVDE